MSLIVSDPEPLAAGIGHAELSRASQWKILAGLSAIAFIAYLQRNAIGIAATPLAADLEFDKQQLGDVLASFYVGYTVGQVPAGLLVDRFGPRRSLALFALGWSLACAAFTIPHDRQWLCIVWALTGVFQSAVFAGATRAARDWLPSRRWASANGAIISSAYLGQAATLALTGVLLRSVSWQTVFLLYAVPGVVWAFLFYTWFRDTPRLAVTMPVLGRSAPAWATWRGQLHLLFSVPLAAALGQQFFRSAAFVFFGTWFPTFLREHRSFDLQQAGLMSSLPLLATVVGSSFGGWLTDRLLIVSNSRRVSRQGVAIGGLVTCGALTQVTMWIDNPYLAAVAFSLASFGFAFAGVAAFTAMMDIGGAHTGAIFSLMNACGNLGGALFSKLVGYLMAEFGDWNLIVHLVSLCYFLAAACWIGLDSSRDLFPSSAEANQAERTTS
jgi:MFS transporter, ACS family, D-galactonate transporter